jgi:DHA2 family multidrug resistance protein
VNDAAGASLAGGARAQAALALALGTFMQVLDTTIANVSVPTIAGDLGVSPDQGTWVITSFAVANGISVPLTGWLMQRYGVVRTFVVSVLLFTLASFLCGIAWSLPSLILFRVLQGAVSGPMIPGSQTLLLAIFPPASRGLALAIWSMTTLVAPICGPIFGGWISDNISWPWIFFINVPIGVLAAGVTWRHLAARETPTRKLPVDGIGLGLLVVWVGALQVMLDKGKDLDWFASTPIVVMAILAAVSFVAFLIWELTDEHPIVDLSLFRHRNFTLATLMLCLGYAVFFGNIVLLTLWMQTQLGYTATWSGLVAGPSGIVAVLISPLVGKMLSRVDARILATFAFLSFGASYFMRANYTADASYFDYMLPLLVQGFGMGTFFVSMLSIMLHGLPADKMPAASGLSNFLRITAGAFSTSISTTFWDRHEALHQTRLAEGSSQLDPNMASALAQLHQAGLSDTAALAVLNRGLVGQSYLMSALDYFWLSGWACMALGLLVWFARRPSGHGPAPVAAE